MIPSGFAVATRTQIIARLENGKFFVKYTVWLVWFV